MRREGFPENKDKKGGFRSMQASRLLCAASALGCCTAMAADGAHSRPSLLDLSLEELTRVVVTSVSRREENIAEAAASVYVITGDDIRRSGATSIPEALRLAPNLHVARVDNNRYAISARGFNNGIANKLLVLLDGRVLYSPLFSGVFWDAQDVMLEDVDRIEVISGPGTTLWGSNAYNGVINITTLPAESTQGTLVAAGAGNKEQGTAVRHGGRLGEDGHYRLYGKLFNRDAIGLASGAAGPDASDRGQAGFRADWRQARGSFTVQGDAYRADIDQLVGGSRELNGANLLAIWRRRLEDGAMLAATAYYDRVERDQPGGVREKLDIFDVEVQGALPRTGAHRFLVGGGYRHARDRLDVIPNAPAFIPPSRNLSWVQAFVSDEIALSERVDLILGLKLEHNDYTGAEWLPNARVAWKLNDHRLLWGAVSRAVRAPSRIDRELFTVGSTGVPILGGPNFQSEVANVFELGYRSQVSRALSYSVTAFYHDHDRIRSIEAVPGGSQLENRIDGTTKGVEAWGTWRVTRDWSVRLGGVRLLNELEFEPGAMGVGSVNAEANDPGHWVTLHSSWNLARDYEADLMVRRVGSLPNPAVPSYTAVDARLGWKAARNLDLSVTLQNLLDAEHVEFGPPATRSEYKRSFFLKLVWRP